MKNGSTKLVHVMRNYWEYKFVAQLRIVLWEKKVLRLIFEQEDLFQSHGYFAVSNSDPSVQV